MLLPLLMLPCYAVQALDYTFTTNNNEITITGYTGADSTVTIPDTINGLPVTSLGFYVFFGSSSSLTSVAVPSTITSINSGTFYDCPNLLEITVDVANSAYSSQDGVLFDKNQTTLILYPRGKAGRYLIPNNVNTIGALAFSSCTRLTGITIGDSVTTINYTAFEYCSSLLEITVDAANSAYSSLDGVLFDKNKSTLILYPNGRTGSYLIPNSVNAIGFKAFASCANLMSITIPNNVTTIRGLAFEYCTSLVNITIPNTVTIIERQAFYNCTSLTSITIPNNLTTIESSMFSFCTSLTSITIPSSVTSIQINAFSNCNNLTSIYFEGNAPSLNGSIFSSTGKIVYYQPETTGWDITYDGCPTVLWYSRLQINGARFSSQENNFEFTINGPSDLVFVVETCESLDDLKWTPVITNTLVDSAFAFNDLQRTNYPTRFYRVRNLEN